MNWTEFISTSLVGLGLALLPVAITRGRKPGRLRREAVEAAQLVLALDAIDAPTELRDQARSASLMSARRALSTAKPSWLPSAVGLVSIVVQAWVATRLFPQATEALWSWDMFAIGLAIAGIAYGVEWALRGISRRFVRAPRDPSGLVLP